MDAVENADDFIKEFGVTDGARTRDNQNHNLSQTTDENSSLPDSFGILAVPGARKNQALAESFRSIFGSFLRLFRWIYIWHLMLGCVGLWSFSAMSTWGSAADVGYNPEGSPIPLKEMERAIEQSIWQHSSRYDVDAEYVGTTGEDEADGKIIIQWESLGLLDERLGYARWWNRKSDGSLVRARIVLNADLAPRSVDPCLMELLVHELGHPLRGTEGHSDQPEDVMYPYRGECRYSLSLSDIQFIGKSLRSCHVELTPDGDLEALDYNGKRISLFAWSPNAWSWKSISNNPHPQYCNGIVVDGPDVWAEVKAFGHQPTILRLKQDNGLFRSIPIAGLAQ